jgi:hypothetical protein
MMMNNKVATTRLPTACHLRNSSNDFAARKGKWHDNNNSGNASQSGDNSPNWVQQFFSRLTVDRRILQLFLSIRSDRAK